MAKEIKISITSGFDPSGVLEASRSIERMQKKLLDGNAELSAAIHNRAAEVAVDYQRAADKGVAQTLLSAKEIEAAWAKAMGKIPNEASKGFGTISQIAKGAANGIGGAFGKVANMFLQGGIWGAAAAAVTKAFKWAWDKIGEDGERTAKRLERNFNESVGAIKNNADAIEKAFSSSMSEIDKSISRFDTMTNSVKELTKAEIELAKQHAIANGMAPAAANAAAEDLVAEVDYSAEENRLRNVIALEQKRIDAAKDAEEKTAEEVRKATEAKKAAEDEYQKKKDEYVKKNAATTGFQAGGPGVAGVNFVRLSEAEIEENRRKAAEDFENSDESAKARENVRKASDALNGIKTDENAIAAAKDAEEKIKNAETALDTLATKREARELAVQNEIAQKVEDEEKAKEDAAKKTAETEAKAKEEAAKKAADVQDRLDREAAMRRERQAEKELADKIKNHQKLLQAEKESAAEARSAESVAESKLQQAWGWYRDKDSMKAQLEEEKADKEAKKQYVKDFKKLKSKRRDWRTAENLSVDEEAVRRVALAKEEKEAADKHLAEIEKNTADLAAKLDELLQVKG